MSPAACQASGKDWATPWSVMAMAGWPQRMASWMTSLVSVRASMLLIFVCRWSSTRFTGAVSCRSWWSIALMFWGSSWMSLPSQVGSIFPWTTSHMPGFTALSRAWASRAARFFWTVTEPVPSVMSKLSRHRPGRRVSRHSKEKTLPDTTAVPIFTFSADMGPGLALTGPPIKILPGFFFCPAFGPPPLLGAAAGAGPGDAPPVTFSSASRKP